MGVNMAIVELPGGGGSYDTVTGQLVSYGFAPGGAVPIAEVTREMVAASPFNNPVGKLGGTITLDDPDDFYNFDASTLLGGGLPLPIPGAIAISRLIGGLAGMGAAATVKTAIGAVRAFAGTAVAGARVAWSQLPGPVQTAITMFTGAVGLDLLMDSGGDDVGLIPAGSLLGPLVPDFGFIGGGGGQAELQVTSLPSRAISTWVANGVTFYRLEDGRLGVINKKGKVKVWRPKKPIVLFAGGAGNLRTMLRADRALDRQAKRIKKMLSRRSPAPRRRAPHHDDHHGHHVHHD